MTPDVAASGSKESAAAAIMRNNIAAGPQGGAPGPLRSGLKPNIFGSGFNMGGSVAAAAASNPPINVNPEMLLSTAQQLATLPDFPSGDSAAAAGFGSTGNNSASGM